MTDASRTQTAVRRRVGLPTVGALVLGVVGLAFAVSACGFFGGSSRTDVASAAGARVAAPEGGAEAELVAGPTQNGVTTLVPVVREDGREVFRDEVAYSSRHGVAITWQSDGSTLWIFSTDVGTFRVTKGTQGWTKSHSTDVPADVRERVGR